MPQDVLVLQSAEVHDWRSHATGYEGLALRSMCAEGYEMSACKRQYTPRAKIAESARAQLLRVLAEAGPAGLTMAEIQDPRRPERTMELTCYRTFAEGVIWRKYDGGPTRGRGRFVRYFGRLEWAEAFEAARSAARVQAPAVVTVADGGPQALPPGPDQGRAPGFREVIAPAFVDRRWYVDPKVVPSRIDGSECRTAYAAALVAGARS